MITAEAIWYERLNRQLGADAVDSRLRGLAHELLATAAGRVVPEDRIESETRRVLDELGKAAGIGPKP